MIPNPESYIGRRFVADVRVVAISPGPATDLTRTVTLIMHGDRAEISLDEFTVLVDSGFLMEVPERSG